MLQNLIIKLINVFPILISIMLLRLLRVKGGYWQDRIIEHIIGYGLYQQANERIINIVEDTYISLSFIGQVIVLIVSIISLTLIGVFKEYNTKPFLFFCIGIVITVLLSGIYLYSLIKLKYLRNRSLKEKCKSKLFKKYTYLQMYDLALRIGYVSLFIITLLY